MLKRSLSDTEDLASGEETSIKGEKVSLALESGGNFGRFIYRKTCLDTTPAEEKGGEG